jgi:hypothetical protein
MVQIRKIIKQHDFFKETKDLEIVLGSNTGNAELEY